MNILIAESNEFSNEAAKIVQSLGDVDFADLDRTELLSRIAGHHVLWVRLRHYIDEEVLAHANALHTIVTATTGVNHIDLEAAEKKGIQVLTLQGHVEFLRNIRATSEHTIALILALQRKIPSAVSDVQKGNWDRDRYKGRELFEKTVGIVGFGRVGRLVVRYLSAFGADCLVTDPLVDTSEFPGTEFTTLEDLLSRSDIVSVHVNLTRDTVQLIGRRELELMKHDALLINTARGKVIDESALLESLENRRIGGAALDVLSNEQSREMLRDPLVGFAAKCNRLIVTPHIGGCTTESMAKTEVFMARQLELEIQRKCAGNRSSHSL